MSIQWVVSWTLTENEHSVSGVMNSHRKWAFSEWCHGHSPWVVSWIRPQKMKSVSIVLDTVKKMNSVSGVTNTVTEQYHGHGHRKWTVGEWCHKHSHRAVSWTRSQKMNSWWVVSWTQSQWCNGQSQTMNSHRKWAFSEQWHGHSHRKWAVPHESEQPLWMHEAVNVEISGCCECALQNLTDLSPSALLHTHTHAYTHTHTHTHMNAHSHACMHSYANMHPPHTPPPYTHTHTHICIHTHVLTCRYTHMYMHTYTCIDMQIHTHVHAYIHALHTLLPVFRTNKLSVCDFQRGPSSFWWRGEIVSRPSWTWTISTLSICTLFLPARGLASMLWPLTTPRTSSSGAPSCRLWYRWVGVTEGVCVFWGGVEMGRIFFPELDLLDWTTGEITSKWLRLYLSLEENSLGERGDNLMIKKISLPS